MKKWSSLFKNLGFEVTTTCTVRLFENLQGLNFEMHRSDLTTHVDFGNLDKHWISQHVQNGTKNA